MTATSADFRRILLEALVIAVFGALLGLAVNYRMVMDLFAERPPVAPPAARTVPQESLFPEPAFLPEVRELLVQGALPVDARAPELYAEGHLPQARSLPLGAAEPEREAFEQEVPRGRVLIVYCSGYGCPDSLELAQQLMAAGYRAVRVFEGGYPEWRDAGLPVETGP